MNKTLGGSTFVWRNNDQDYHIIETLECLYELCDEVSVVYGGNDGTLSVVGKWIMDKDWSAKTIHAATISQKEWDSQKGREKLSHFSNLAIGMLTTDWNIYIQADEVLHEDSFPFVRAAIEDPQADGYLLRRLNLWKDPYHMLNVPQERKPVSTEVIRLAKTKFMCFDDAESLGVSGMVGVLGDIDNMQIYHSGFVRDKIKHLEKIRHMQMEVFLWGDYDVKAKHCSEFQPDRWFDPEKDLVPIPRPLPRFVQQWAQDRYPDISAPEDRTKEG
jgi:hypothetical protein